MRIITKERIFVVLFNRDLLKCCRRLSTLSISTSIHRQLAFSDLIDCFAAFLLKENRLSVIQTIGTLFNMNNQEVRWKDFPIDRVNHHFSSG